MKNLLIIPVFFILAFSGCVKEEIDPVPEYTVDYESNTSIADLKALYQGTNLIIDTNIIIKGIVVADDSTGNFYKSIYIQDETAGISISLDETDLFNKFPIGRMVYVKCNGLAIGKYNSDTRYETLIGWGIGVDRIPSTYMSENNVPDISTGGSLIEPKLVTFATLSDDDIGKLVKIENVQFIDDDLTKTFHWDIASSASSTEIENCDGISLEVRTSEYAIFANETVPQGNGTFIAILSKYNGNYQFKIRNTDELTMTGTRCVK